MNPQISQQSHSAISFLSHTYASSFAIIKGGLRPYTRWKHSEQGTFYCRLRRKRKDINDDGGNNSKILETIRSTKLF